MKKLILLISSALIVLLPLACSKTYTSSPVNDSAFTPTATFTATPWGGQVTTLAGSAGVTGSTNATGTSATFDYPHGIAVDTAGNVYVADTYNSLIRKISPGGVVTTLAGGGPGHSTNGTGTAASFWSPYDVAVDTSGNVYVADTTNCLIRMITPGGVVSTLAGSGVGSSNGTGTAASFDDPEGIAVDAFGNVYVADTFNELIRKVTPGGVVTTLAGSVGVTGASNGTGTAATFHFPTGVAVDSSGNVLVLDFGNELVRKITPGGVVTTLAGGGSGHANGTGTAASFLNPNGIAVDASGNVYVADTWNNLIRMVTPGGVVTTFSGAGLGSANGSSSSATFDYPDGVAVDGSGNVYVADTSNSLIREIAP